MGIVFEAYQEATGRRVAIKFLPDAAAATPAARMRFEREVDLVARLQHPNIVGVLDSGIHSGRYWYAMEYIDGKSFDEYLGAPDSTPRADATAAPGAAAVDPRRVLRLIAAIADAVDFAHQHGVLHRDLKPSNVVIDERGQPHVLDFGLAKGIDPTGSSADVTLSEPGQLLGTLAYMSPEQSRGRSDQVSVRSDVYALGAMAYESVTGRPPIAVDGALVDVLDRIAHRDPPRPSTIRGRLSVDIDAMLLKALNKSPAARYATAGEFAADIRRFLNHEPILARRIGQATRAMRWARRNKATAIIIEHLV